jgi:cytochrome P450
MTLHPEVQKRAQFEIDSVVGPDRLPCLEDRPNLPYVEALLSEVLRWNPVGPLGTASFMISGTLCGGLPHEY